MCVCVSERDWREKQKAAECLRDTIEKQRADLERVRKELGEKEMLSSALRVSVRSHMCSPYPKSISGMCSVFCSHFVDYIHIRLSL